MCLFWRKRSKHPNDGECNSLFRFIVQAKGSTSQVVAELPASTGNGPLFSRRVGRARGVLRNNPSFRCA